MQISAATLLASQSQTSVRPRGTPAAFEPIAFKQTPVTPDLVRQAPATAPAQRSTVTAPASGSYVRPGTNLDIKI